VKGKQETTRYLTTPDDTNNPFTLMEMDKTKTYEFRLTPLGPDQYYYGINNQQYIIEDSSYTKWGKYTIDASKLTPEGVAANPLKLILKLSPRSTGAPTP
jgi:hypothetical protein